MLRPTRLPAQPLRTRPRVSVAIPNYNYGRFLPAAIGSALDQPGVDVDVLVVDNASTDESVPLVRAMAERDSRIRLIEHAANQGPIASFNEGARETDGDYYVLLCADDLLTPGSLAQSAALMEAHPNVGFTYGWVKSFPDDDVPAVTETEVTGWSVWSGGRWLQARYRDARNVIVIDVVMRRSVIDQLSYDPRCPERSDLLMWLRAALITDVGHVHGPCQALQRVHDGRLSATHYAGLLTDLRYRLAVFELVLDEEGRDLPNGDRLRRDIRQALASESLRLARRCHDRGEPIGGSTAEEYEEFAVEAWPEIRRSRAWRAYQLRVRGLAPQWLKDSSEQAHRVQHHLRWRLWRQYGI